MQKGFAIWLASRNASLEQQRKIEKREKKETTGFVVLSSAFWTFDFKR
jgi:hypothetical protein